MKEKSDSFRGQIGSNISQSRIEVEENILRLLYEWWIQEKRLDKNEICKTMGLNRRQLAYYIHSMIEHGYIEEAEEKEYLFLTDFGKEQGHECRERHQNITHFIQLTCGVEEEIAAESACRMEHVVGEEVIDGIFKFLKNGEIYDSEIRDMNFTVMYEPGEYEFCMTLYESDKRYPRILAEEFKDFSDTFLLQVNEESFVQLFLKNPADDWHLWYQRGAEWKQAARTEDGFLLPASIFLIVKSQMVSITEGTALIGLTKEDRPPLVEDCRELNIHMW